MELSIKSRAALLSYRIDGMENVFEVTLYIGNAISVELPPASCASLDTPSQQFAKCRQQKIDEAGMPCWVLEIHIVNK